MRGLKPEVKLAQGLNYTPRMKGSHCKKYKADSDNPN